jgi:hypothetical protein
MLVSNIEVLPAGNECELRAQVKTHASRKPILIRYRFPRAFEQVIDSENGDPFLPALLLPAMKAHEALEIPAPVSARLLDSIPRIQSIYASWDKSLSRVPIEAPVRQDELSPADSSKSSGLFFSCGVDSFYSLLKNAREHLDDKDAITHLVVVDGFDTYFGRRNGRAYTRLLTNARRVGLGLGKEVLPVATNLRDFGSRFVDWRSLYYGAFLASIGLALRKYFKKIRIASAHSYTQFIAEQIIEGSHPMLDPQWSTESTSFVHDGSEARRLDKVRFISQFPIALQTLRVCFIHSYGEVPYNCGCCYKCLRTMIALHMTGMLPKSETFPHSLDPGLLRNLFISDTTFIEELVDGLGFSETDSAIRSCLKEGLSGRSKMRRRIFHDITYALLTYLPSALPLWRTVQTVLTPAPSLQEFPTPRVNFQHPPD